MRSGRGGLHVVLAAALAVVAAGAPAASSAATAPPPAAAKGIAGLKRTDGFIPFYWDAARGRVLLEISQFDTDVLYYVQAATGGGSVELPFDRGVLDSEVIRFERVGQRVLVNEVNLDYRSINGDAAHAANTTTSFPTSVLAVLPIEDEADGHVVVDATALFMRDAANVEGRLKQAKQGAYKFDAARSTFYPAKMKAFPENTEIETVATFTGDGTGALVRNVTPDARMFTLRIHHSFLKAPTGYTPRQADPRIGVSAIRFHDYSKAVSDPTNTEWITRWRLEKKDPNAALSEPVKPITFYFDPAIPAPLRHAMEQGVMWWNKAYEQAGFKNAIVAKDAPPDMDPMDIRYAYVMWIDRDERGFSSGGTFRDPRTGEILGSKTHMDSSRVRTIASFFDAYSGGLPSDGTGITVADPSLLTPDGLDGMPPAQRDMVLLRQALLTAHELGHAQGFSHNFAASLNDRASVMDYPTPRVKVTKGKLDLSDAFQTSVGAYDDYMVRYAYTPFAPDKEKAGLNAVIKDMRDHGIIFTPMSDPRWTWYDDRATPQENLRETMAARKIMLADYGQGMLKPGEAVGSMRDMRLWMAYLHDRYAIESGLKYVGGLFTNITVKGEDLPPTEFIPGKTQHEVLDLLMDEIEPDSLSMPDALVAQLTPDPGGNLEDMSDDAAFDPLQAARIRAALVLEPLFDKDRAERMVALATRQGDALTFPQMVDEVMARTWKAGSDGTAKAKAMRRVSQAVALDSMMVLGGADGASPEARAYVLDQLAQLSTSLKARKDADPLTQAFYRQTAKDIDRYLEDPKANAPKAVSPAWGGKPRSRYPLPPGPPMGG
ncbi:zinc-dependent metalloprotease [Phenylobacterium sp.]|uniref:zinc-dependent metalloprotease n=1 Tax=Phenylobacterium sp. TaxID=1871053 RepID=UPI0035B04241